MVCSYRLIERFRHAAPKSREERSRDLASGSKDFWWLAPSSSSTPTHPSSSSTSSQHHPPQTTPKPTSSFGIHSRSKEGGVRTTGARGGASWRGQGRGRGRGVSRIPSLSSLSRGGASIESSRRMSGVSTLASSSVTVS